jgi:hypothetical protein
MMCLMYVCMHVVWQVCVAIREPVDTHLGTPSSGASNPGCYTRRRQLQRPVKP